MSKINDKQIDDLVEEIVKIEKYALNSTKKESAKDIIDKIKVLIEEACNDNKGN